jgi:hypothetical protein
MMFDNRRIGDSNPSLPPYHPFPAIQAGKDEKKEEER